MAEEMDNFRKLRSPVTLTLTLDHVKVMLATLSPYCNKKPRNGVDGRRRQALDLFAYYDNQPSVSTFAAIWRRRSSYIYSKGYLQLCQLHFWTRSTINCANWRRVRTLPTKIITVEDGTSRSRKVFGASICANSTCRSGKPPANLPGPASRYASAMDTLQAGHRQPTQWQPENRQLHTVFLHPGPHDEGLASCQECNPFPCVVL